MAFKLKLKMRKSNWGNVLQLCCKHIPIFLIFVSSYSHDVTSMSPVPLTEPCLSDSNNSAKNDDYSIRNSRSASNNSNSVKTEDDIMYSHRLPTSVIPEKYFLTITPILVPGFEDTLGEQWSAPGHILIRARAVKPTRSIILHAKNITVNDITITRESENIPVKNISEYRKYSYLTIQLSENLVPGEHYEISITFTSYVSEVLNGLFRSSYKDEITGATEWFAATHMEALHARQMFPCFDEPSYKAPIQAMIGRHENYTALFNTESIRNDTMDHVNGWVWETFAPTVAMSTYLTALVVSKFTYSEATGNLLPDVRVRTYAPPHFVKQGAVKYAANTAERILYTYGNYFEEKYPMKKFDSVAVPSFLYGAMENYGLSIFRETLLLHFENQTTETQRYIVTNVLNHELGHQWFGNLVSPDWWTQLWLSEGLTKFTEYIGLNATVPEFQPWDIFITESLQLGLRLDADHRTSHSLKIDEDAWTLKSEMEWFDDIAYKKGGALIRMMQGFLTEPVLRKGLGKYLSRLKYKAAVQDDLFADCEIEGRLAHKLPENTTLGKVMADWTLKSGFPLLRVEHVPGRNTVKVFQEKYFASQAFRKMTKSKSTWYIPVSVATKGKPIFDPEPEFWIRKNESSVVITLPTTSWIILNAGTTGFYRVIYDEELSRRITEQLMEDPTKIDKLARSQLFDDNFNAAYNRYIHINQALNLTRYLNYHSETENVVWSAIFTMLKGAYRLFKEQSEDFDIFKTYFLPRVEKAIHAVGGFDAVNQFSKGMPVIRHSQLLDWACNLGSQGCIEYSTNLVKLWNSTGLLQAPRDFRAVILSAAVSNDPTGQLFDFVMQQYKATIINNDTYSTSQLKEHLLTALSSTRNHDKIKSLLDSICHNNNIPNEDAAMLLQHLATNVAASDMILNYFNENLQAIVEKFGDTSPITATTSAMAPHLKSLSGLFLMEELAKNNDDIFKASFAPVINRIRANIIWYDEFGEEMLQFFEQNK